MMASFSEWIKGQGEGMFGCIIKSSARKEARRLRSVLGGRGLFPHIDHETKIGIERAEAAADYGQKKIDRHAKRQKQIEALADSIEPPTCVAHGVAPCKPER